MKLTSFLFQFKKLNLFSISIIRNYSSLGNDLTNYQKEAIIGLILGDLHISKVKKTYNARLMFKQGLKNCNYIIHLFYLFSDYCISIPKIKSYFDKRTNKTYYSIYFDTRSLSIFNYYHSLFYDNEGVKLIPSNIGDLLTPVGLAYWAMDDGNKHRTHFYLNTDSFSLDDTILLIKVLKENFDLNCSFHKKRKGQYRIYILKDSIEKFKTLVTPYFHQSMLYKLQI